MTSPIRALSRSPIDPDRASRRPGRGPLPCVALAAALTVVVAGCGGSGSTSSTPAAGAGAQAARGQGAQSVAVSVTPAGCTASPASVPAGAVNFTVRNVGAAAVDEIELSKAGDDDILGSREDLKPGTTRTFSLRLAAGPSSLGCDGATNDTGPLTVTGSAAAPALSAAQQAVASGYKTYALARADELIARTKIFTDALRGGNLTAAMAAYGPAHMIYEDIEFVGDHVDDGKLDEAIDARQTPTQEEGGGMANWTGFHRLEKMTFGDRTLAGAPALATKLDSDVAAFRSLLVAHSFTPPELANGAAASIDESLEVHLPALEDHYSHTSLWDVAGKLASATKISSLLGPSVAQTDTGVASQVQTALTTMTDKMATLRTSDGRYLDYSTVGSADRQILTTDATRLDDALSKLPALVV
jgi:iron uptake system component EfeO